jgi:hypothetical protein
LLPAGEGADVVVPHPATSRVSAAIVNGGTSRTNRLVMPGVYRLSSTRTPVPFCPVDDADVHRPEFDGLVLKELNHGGGNIDGEDFIAVWRRCKRKGARASTKIDHD